MAGVLSITPAGSRIHAGHASATSSACTMEGKADAMVASFGKGAQDQQPRVPADTSAASFANPITWKTKRLMHSLHKIAEARQFLTFCMQQVHAAIASSQWEIFTCNSVTVAPRPRKQILLKSWHSYIGMYQLNVGITTQHCSCLMSVSASTWKNTTSMQASGKR
jgi:hypothetical protein